MGIIADNLHSIVTSLKNSITKLIVVTKTHDIESIMEVYSAGYKVFGENKVQELCDKYERMPKDIEWHMIGHLQRNKVKYITNFVSLIHTVDSIELLKEINKHAGKHNRIQNCLLQMYIAQEETKFGLTYDELTAILNDDSFATLKNIKIVGLMGMASNTSDKQQIMAEFKGLKQLFDKIKIQYFHDQDDFKELSMGMSGDYLLAMEAGSTMIRVGSAIFGNRNYQL